MFQMRKDNSIHLAGARATRHHNSFALKYDFFTNGGAARVIDVVTAVTTATRRWHQMSTPIPNRYLTSKQQVRRKSQNPAPQSAAPPKKAAEAKKAANDRMPLAAARDSAK